MFDAPTPQLLDEHHLRSEMGVADVGFIAGMYETYLEQLVNLRCFLGSDVACNSIDGRFGRYVGTVKASSYAVGAQQLAAHLRQLELAAAHSLLPSREALAATDQLIVDTCKAVKAVLAKVKG